MVVAKIVNIHYLAKRTQESLDRPFVVPTLVSESIIDILVYRGCIVEIIYRQTFEDLVNRHLVCIYNFFIVFINYIFVYSHPEVEKANHL